MNEEMVEAVREVWLAGYETGLESALSQLDEMSLEAKGERREGILDARAVVDALKQAGE